MAKKVRPCLWFNFNAEEAVNFYRTVFKDFEVLDEQRYPDPNPVPGGEEVAGKVLTMVARIFDEEILFLNGGPYFQLSEAFSLAIETADQEETDYYWYALIADGGQEQPCGWLKDRFGLSWQITPARLNELTTDPDPSRAMRANQAMLQMTRIDIAAIEAAADAV
ncbi:MAG: VOC family protein [Thermomicrobiales bacterium]|nr:VOC family protein [Thermomicrobiales bacterium]